MASPRKSIFLLSLRPWGGRKNRPHESTPRREESVGWNKETSVVLFAWANSPQKQSCSFHKALPKSSVSGPCVAEDLVTCLHHQQEEADMGREEMLAGDGTQSIHDECLGNIQMPLEKGENAFFLPSSRERNVYGKTVWNECGGGKWTRDPDDLMEPFRSQAVVGFRKHNNGKPRQRQTLKFITRNICIN